MIQGLAQLEQRIKSLPLKVEKRIVRKALNKAAGAMVRGIRKQVPKGDTKSAAKEIGKRITTKGGQVIAKVGVGVSSPKKKKKGEKPKSKSFFGSLFGRKHRQISDVSKYEPHAHLLALGTKARYTGEISKKRRDGSVYVKKTKSGRAYRGFLRPDGFVKRGAMGARQEFARLLQESIKAGIEKEAAK